MIYFRFILWSNLIDEYDNVVYLDCDTIILKPFPKVFELNDFFAISDNSEQFNQGIFSAEEKDNKSLLALLRKDNIKFLTIN